MNPARKLQQWLFDTYWADEACLLYVVVWFFAAIIFSVVAVIVGIVGLFAFDSIWLAISFLLSPIAIMGFYFWLIGFIDNYDKRGYSDENE